MTSAFVFLLMPWISMATNQTDSIDRCDNVNEIYCTCQDRTSDQELWIGYSCSIPQLTDDQVSDILADISENATSWACTACKLSRIPPPIQQLTRLRRLNLNGNRGIRILANGSLPSMDDADYVGLSLMGLEAIEPGAFRGNYSSATVNLAGNDLIRFESEVFQDVLESMASGTGSINLYENRIICDCNLTWLIRYNRQYLPSISDGRCEDGTDFFNLDPEKFDDCPMPTDPPSCAKPMRPFNLTMFHILVVFIVLLH